MAAMHPWTATCTLALLAAVLVGPAEAGAPLDRGRLQRALHAASVVVEPSRCAGVLAEARDLVFTARHCVRGRRSGRVTVRFATGETRGAAIVATDSVADQALLLLDDPVPIEPLLLVRRQPQAGTVLYFQGNPARPQFQRARIDRVGRCPSLPHLPNALFTSVRGQPGDSGAPLVDGMGRVVGLVHGGERCHIATPAHTLARLIHRVFEWETAPVLVAGATPRTGNGRRRPPGAAGSPPARLSAPARSLAGSGARRCARPPLPAHRLVPCRGASRTAGWPPVRSAPRTTAPPCRTR
jgi:hypothetical protein